MSIYILSQRGLQSAIFYDNLFELEDILVQTCEGKLLIPTARNVKQWAHQRYNYPARLLHRIVRSTVGSYRLLDDVSQSLDRPSVLFVFGIYGLDLKILESIPNWRKRFDIVAAYICDAWLLKSYPKYTSQIDHLFVPMPELINVLKQHLGIPVSLLPFASDVLTHGSGGQNRPIDLISYGRIPKQYHLEFVRKFNQPGSGRIYYRTTPRSREVFPEKSYEDRREQEDRMLFGKILRRSKLALAFDSIDAEMRQFPHPFLTMRWFECGAAGCVIIGKRPNTPLTDELLNWKDSTIELPDNPQESVEFVEELLHDEARLNAIHRRNYIENLARHDWRIRIKDMLEKLNIELPHILIEELSQLNRLHANWALD